MSAPPSLPDVDIISVLGVGGFGAVYLARHRGTEVALKVANDPRDPRFAREVDALRRLGPPVTPAFIAAGVAPDGRPYVIMERLVGRTLSPHEPPGVARAIVAAVAHVHAAGFIHRDLKPDNIFVRADGTIA